MRPHFNGKKLGVMVHACHPSYWSSINGRVVVQANSGVKRYPISKITHPKRAQVGLNSSSPKKKKNTF
jgi:hypothetical protein